MELVDYLKKLSLLTGISGRENSVREYMKKEFEKYCESVEIDRFGNLIGRIGSGNKKLMIAAHMDEIGLMVKYIDDKGFLKFVKIGGINDQMLLNQKVIVHTEKGDYIGVLGSKPPHKMKGEEKNKLIKAENMFIDVGAKSREDAEKMGIEIGSWITFKTDFDVLANNRITCKAFDDRVGCAILLYLAKELSERKPDCEVYLVGTVQEEVGLKGARTSAFGIYPDMAFAVDVTICGDHPGISMEDAPVEMGKGPVFGIVDAAGRGLISHPDVVKLVKKAAEESGISVQYEVGDGGTTDATAIQLTKEGIPTGVISVPARYIHTPVEVIEISDLENTAKLFLKVIEKFTKN
ncbi:M42 family metallopeptidase [Desulfurobacterium atlanticum]|uniref:Endoglucanase n=1 Tax=Desulfurobacterium atlanticum TaxID=240169 RepID=A0A239A5K9_9BACT|nr:M42 family metallopeptidase [Desulfurobacterium atlanticum]SNR90722.1 endoglucanase [Desulfurobacterium atlanticum]